MRLLTFAHRGEAQIFLKEEKFVPFEGKQNLYACKAKDLFLLITKEGPFEAQSKLAYTLGLMQSKISEVINLGIAGGINPRKVKKHQIYSIRTVYLQNTNESMDFHSYTSNDNETTTDCVTSFKRVLDLSLAKKLRPFAPIVDRELWALAKTCRDYHVPWRSFKLLSDVSTEQIQCSDIKNQAWEYSLKLYEFYQNHLMSLESSPENPSEIPEELYFTTSQKRQYLTDRQMLYAKYPKEAQGIIKACLEKAWRKENWRAKEKTKYFLKSINRYLNPLEKEFEKGLTQSLAPLQKQGIRAHFKNTLEEGAISVEAQIKNPEDIQALKKALDDWPFQKTFDLMQGDLNV